MQVADITELASSATLGAGKAQRMSMAEDPALYLTMIISLYPNVKLAFIRETICNQWDAHIASGRTDTPIKITIDLEESLDVTPNVAPVVKATDVKPIEKKKSNMELADELWNKFQNAETATVAAEVAGELIALKGKMKKPWSALGLSSEMVQQLADARTKMPVERKPEPVKKAVVSAPAKGSKHADTIRGYLNDAGMTDYSKAHAIHDLKRAAKKSYAALGLNEDEIKAIEKLKHHL